MRLIRFKDRNNKTNYGWVSQEKVGLIQGDPFGEFRRFEANLLLSDLRLLIPCLPSKIIAVGRNYREHAREMDAQVPEYPMIFLKPPSALITNGDPIIVPSQSTRVEHEAELVLVVGKRVKDLKPNEIDDAIFGFTIANDVTARDLQKKDQQWSRAKGFDTFCPLGPWIETEFDPSDALISCYVNNELRQLGSTKDMVFNPKQLLAYVSSIMTLEPGDIILTGTPAGVGPIAAGDLVNIHIDGLGTLVNPVVNG